MKKLFLVLFCLFLMFGYENPASADPTNNPANNPNNDRTDNVIRLWSSNDEVPSMVNKFLELHPDFNYTFKFTILSAVSRAYQTVLDQALAAGGENAPDIYCVESSFTLDYTQGNMAHYAAPYTDLGIDVDERIQAADIAQYSIDLGSDNGVVKGLGYQGTSGAFIYRRSIAMDVWGTDDPDFIKTKIGPGWDTFFKAASELKKKGYPIVSSFMDLWYPVQGSSAEGWVVDGKLNLPPERKAFMDHVKTLEDNGYCNGTETWTDAWFDDLSAAGPKDVFGFFGPAWFINYVMAGNAGDTYGDWAVCEPTAGFFWGGTWVLANKDSPYKEAVGEIIEWITLDTSTSGLQYLWASGTLNSPGGIKDTVTSKTVMKISDGTLDYLDGQDMNDVYSKASAMVTGSNVSPYDEAISVLWLEEVDEYVAGNKTRIEAIEDWKNAVFKELGLVSNQ